MKEIIVDIAPDGATKVTTRGWLGTACKAATKFLQDALGITTKDATTAEYHQQAENRKVQQ